MRNMNFFQQFVFGLKCFVKAIKFIIQHKMYWYFVFPAALMLLIYYVGSFIVGWNADWSPIDGCLSCANMNDTIWFLLKMLLTITIGVILMKFAKYIVVVLLSPLLSILSQNVEKKLTNNTYPFNMQQLWEDIKRAFRIALRNIMWEYIFFIIIVVISAIGWKEASESPIFYLTFAIGFYYYGFSFMDYINERRRLDIDQSIFFVRKNKGLAMSIGCVYSLLILVPVDLGLMIDYSHFYEQPLMTIGISFFQFILWMLASISPVLTIVATTIAMHELLDLGKNEFANHNESDKTLKSDIASI